MTDDIVEAIKTKIEQVGGIECVKMESHDNGRPMTIYVEDDLYSTLFDLSLRDNIVSMCLRWGDDVVGYVLDIETAESSDGSTNITIELIQTIAEYLGRNTGRGFMGQRGDIRHELSLYKPYIRKKRRIAFVDVSYGRFDVVKTVDGHDGVKEWAKENNRFRKWHFSMVYGGGYGDLIDEHGISRKKKEYVVIQMSEKRPRSDLVEDWRWECLFKNADLPYPKVDVWKCPDYYYYYYDRHSFHFDPFSDDLEMP